MGSAQSAAGIAARLAQAVGGWALVPDYRLAPEHPFPAALGDALVAYRWLASQTTAPVYVSGNDAGGALSMALAVEAKKSGLRTPAALYAISPFCDLSVSSASARELGPSDPWYKRNILMLYAARYIQETDASDPRISPLHADLSGLPPLLIHASAEEALRDDATALAGAAKRAGVKVTLHLFDDTVHSFPLFADLPESADALREWTAFAKATSA
jgi:acetyl esterase/lipase